MFISLSSRVKLVILIASFSNLSNTIIRLVRAGFKRESINHQQRSGWIMHSLILDVQPSNISQQEMLKSSASLID